MTNEEKEKYQNIINGIVNYNWSKIENRMLCYGETFEEATIKVLEEMTKSK